MKKVILIIFFITTLLQGCQNNIMSDIEGKWKGKDGDIIEISDGNIFTNEGDGDIKYESPISEKYKKIDFNDEKVDKRIEKQVVHLLITTKTPNNETYYKRMFIILNEDKNIMNTMLFSPVSEEGDNLSDTYYSTQEFKRIDSNKFNLGMIFSNFMLLLVSILFIVIFAKWFRNRKNSIN